MGERAALVLCSDKRCLIAKKFEEGPIQAPPFTSPTDWEPFRDHTAIMGLIVLHWEQAEHSGGQNCGFGKEVSGSARVPSDCS